MVKDGALTQAQADAMIQRMRSHMQTQPRTGMMGGHGMMWGFDLTR
jgi:hypothetical protein